MRQSRGGKRQNRAVGERAHGVTGAGRAGKEAGWEEAFDQRGAGFEMSSGVAEVGAMRRGVLALAKPWA